MLDWFIPFNFARLNIDDDDLGAAGVLLIPNTKLLASGGKEGKLYLLNRRRLGHFRRKADKQIVQSFMVAKGEIAGTPTYWNGPHGPHVYLWGPLITVKCFVFTNGNSIQNRSRRQRSRQQDWVEFFPFQPTGRLPAAAFFGQLQHPTMRICRFCRHATCIRCC